MEELNFLPSYCKEKKEKQRKLKCLIFILLSIIFNTFFAFKNIENKNKIASIENEIEAQREQNRNSFEKKSSKKWETIKSLEVFMKSIGCDIECRSLHIKDTSIEMELSYKSEEEYLDIVKNIEKICQCKIISLYSYELEGGEFGVKVVVEVKG